MYICHICLVVLDVDLLQIQRQWPGKIMVDEMLPPRGSCEYYTVSTEAVFPYWLYQLLMNTNYLYVYLFK